MKTRIKITETYDGAKAYTPQFTAFKYHWTLIIIAFPFNLIFYIIMAMFADSKKGEKPRWILKTYWETMIDFKSEGHNKDNNRAEFYDLSSAQKFIDRFIVSHKTKLDREAELQKEADLQKIKKTTYIKYP